MYQIDKIQFLQIGVQGENDATNIEIDMTSWVNQFPDAVFHILFKPYNASAPSPMLTTYADGVLTWTVGVGATAVVGVGYTEIRAQDVSTGLIKKSRIIPTSVDNSVSGVEITPPASYQEWVTDVLNAGTDAKNSAAAAMAYSQGKQIKFEIGDDEDPDGMAGHLLFYFKDEEDEEWEDYLDLGPVDVYATAVAAGYTGTKAQWIQSIEDAEANAQKSEKYAVGKVNGTDVGSDDPTYHNNSKYYSEQAAAAKTAAEAAQAAAETAAQTDLVAWLEQNITNPDSPPLDRSLSSSSSATPADITGDLKSALNTITGNEVFSFTNGSYINDNVAVGADVSLTPVTAPTNPHRNNYAVVNASAGEAFTINGVGGNAGRLWAFIDSSNKLISKSNNAASASDYVLIAPAGTSKLILNVLDNPGLCCRGIYIKDQEKQTEDTLNEVIDDTIEIVIGKNKCPPTLFDGYIDTDGMLKEYSDWKTTDFIYVGDFTKKAVYSVSNSSDVRLSNIAMYFLTTYDANKAMIEQIADPNNIYTIGEGVKYIRFSVHSNTYHDLMVEDRNSSSASPFEPYSKTYKAVNEEYALNSDLDALSDTVQVIKDKVDEIAIPDYQIYNANFSETPSAIENNGNIIDTLTGTKTTDYIDCSTWVSIRYTGSSWLVCRCLAFYDENKTWISSMPATGDTTEYTNEIVSIPSNAKYIILADLTAKQTQTLKIEIATGYKVTGKWTGKKWTCVGDSLTEHNNRTTMNYHDYVANATGITVVNMGRSGTGYKRTYDEGYAFYQRIGNVPNDSDVVTIFGSGNDLLYAENIGTPTDTFDSEHEADNTLCACINHTIDILIGNIPTVQLGIVAPTPWKGEKPTLNNTNSMAQYVEALRQICYIRSIPFLDLYHCSNLRPWTEEGRTACYSKDGNSGVHPDEAGHKIIASRFEGFLDSLLLGN